MSSLKGEENKKEEESSVSLSSYKNVHLLLHGEACGASFLPWPGFKAVLLETKVKLNLLALTQRKTNIQCDGLENEA